jgi:hypothetical protein
VAETRDTGHEPRDIEVRSIVRFAVVLTVVAAVLHVAIWLAFEAFAARARRADPEPGPLASARPRAPPEPRLRVAPVRDLARLREAEERTLTTYGWVDRERGLARVPVERAIELVLERGMESGERAREEMGG